MIYLSILIVSFAIYNLCALAYLFFFKKDFNFKKTTYSDKLFIGKDNVSMALGTYISYSSKATLKHEIAHVRYHRHILLYIVCFNIDVLILALFNIDLVFLYVLITRPAIFWIIEFHADWYASKTYSHETFFKALNAEREFITNYIISNHTITKRMLSEIAAILTHPPVFLRSIVYKLWK